MAAQQKAEEEVRRSAVLIEWERTRSPPQSEQVCKLDTDLIKFNCTHAK